MVAVILALMVVFVGGGVIVVVATRPTALAEIQAYVEKLKEGGAATILPVVTRVFGLLAGLAWVIAAFSAIEMLKFKKPEVSIWQLAVNGLAFFDDANWLPQAQPHKQRLVTAFVWFFCLVIPAALLGILSSAKPSAKRLVAADMH